MDCKLIDAHKHANRHHDRRAAVDPDTATDGHLHFDTAGRIVAFERNPAPTA
jgi:hypothetical protein